MNTHNVKTATKESSERWEKKMYRRTDGLIWMEPVLIKSGTLPPLRGLDIRILFAKAKVMRVIDSIKAEREIEDVLEGAYFLGFLDSCAAKQTPPLIFADEPELLAAWEEGFHSHNT